MSDSEKKTTTDVLGLGAIAKAIPPESWNNVVELACTTVKHLLAPITNSFAGLGRLIEARFDRMVDAQKVLAAESLKSAVNKTHSFTENADVPIKATVILAALEAVSIETDSTMRELWANLIAQELAGGAVHPMFPKILSELGPSDARELANIANQEPDSTWGNVVLRVSVVAVLTAMLGEGARKAPPASFTHEHLASLRLIREQGGRWVLTETGKEFIRSVSEPVADQ
jgi:hypothetical protein